MWSGAVYTVTSLLLPILSEVHMRRFAMVLFACGAACAQQSAPTQLTIYNGDFALVRTTVPLDLHPGGNEVLTTNVTSQVEPDSVVLSTLR